MPSSFVTFGEGEALRLPHFPTRYLGVIWRFWGMISAETLAKVLETTPQEIRASAEGMGLDAGATADEALWRERGYITLIRDAWHLLTFDQICTLLDVDAAALDTTLKEDDFLYYKMGDFAPEMEKTVWHPLSEAERCEVDLIRRTYGRYRALLCDHPDHPFAFLQKYGGRADIPPQGSVSRSEDLRIIYPYFALYGDFLAAEDCDPFPDRLLAAYASYGINGLWMQGVLYQLAPYPFCPTLSEGWERRQANLQRIVDKAAKYGIGIYLYINEPRAMSEGVLKEHPHIKGHIGKAPTGLVSLCTSTPEVQTYLEEAMYRLFSGVKGLAGFLTITASENQTNCYSHSHEETCTCPRCKGRSPAEVVAEVNNLMARGAKRADPKARAIAWSWGWHNKWKTCTSADVIGHLDKGIIVQTVSESGVPVEKGGVVSKVEDYSISHPGPGMRAKTDWAAAKTAGLDCMAKVQFNCSWELPCVPYIPVFDLVARHASGLRAEGVRHLMLSWTLGGAPSPNLLLGGAVLRGESGEAAVRRLIEELYPSSAAEAVYRAQALFSAAFEAFPFHISVLYNAPQNAGPKAPFFPLPTGQKASMTCFPYDDIKRWSGVFPAEVLEGQFAAVLSGWQAAIAVMEDYHGPRNEALDEFSDMLSACYAHYATNLHLIRFVRRRDLCLEKGFTKEDYAYLADILTEEEQNVLHTLRLQARDSRIGFEAANHYCFTRQDLTEKLLNIAWCKRYYEQAQMT